MFVRADMCVQPAASVLATLDQALGSMRPFRIAIFLQRAASVAWNEWVSKWELRGRSALVWGAQSLRMRVYNLQTGSESWHEVDGPWELHVIDSGYQPVGHGISVMPCMLALRNFCRRKESPSATSSQPFARPISLQRLLAKMFPPALILPMCLLFGTSGMPLPLAEPPFFFNVR